MGLGNFDITYILLTLLILLLIFMIITIVLLVKINKLNKRCNKFMKGKNAKSLEDEIAALFDKQEEIEEILVENKKDIKDLYKKFEKAFQKIGIIKYDAFNQMGGQLSYCIALLDENNDGFVINSVHGADGCYSYTKEIKNGKSTIELGAEETKALDMAMNR